MVGFWRQLLVNMIAVAVPAGASIFAMGILVRSADPETAGIVLWTWFLMSTAAGLNIGLHPSLTNDLGALTRKDPGWPSVLAHYITASNTIFLAVAVGVTIWGLIASLEASIFIAQLSIVWLTGIVSLVMTALNFNGDATRTAASKLLFNTLGFLFPVVVILVGGSALASLLTVLVIKALQLWITANIAERRMQQSIHPVWTQPIDVHRTISILKRQWKLVVISGTQMSFSFIDRFIVIALYGIAEYKYYGGILDVLGIVWVGSSIFIILLHPKLAQVELSDKAKDKLADSFSQILLITGGAVLSLLLWKSDLVLGLVLDVKLTSESYVIVRNLIFGLFFNLSYILYNTLLISTGKQGAVLYISLPVLFIYCCFAPWITAERGLVGLSYAFLFRFAVEALAFHAVLIVSRRKQKR